VFSRLLNFSNYYLNFYAVPVFIVSILIFFIGGFVLIQNKNSIINISFFLKCFSAGFWLFTISFVYSCRVPAVAHTWYKYFTFFGVASIAPNLYLFSVVWSDRMKQQRIFLPLVYFVFYMFYGLAASSDIFIKPEMHRYFWGLYPIYGKAAFLFVICFTIVYAASFLNTYSAYRREQEKIKKAQKGFIALVLLIGYTGSFDFISKFFDVTFFPVGYIGIFCYISLVAYSIVRYRAFDIETALHKTALWLLSFSFIIFPAFFLYEWFFPRMKESTILQFVFWTGSFLVFTFYLRVIQPKVDHFFKRRESNLEETLSKFMEDLVYLKGLDNLIQRIEQTIADTLYPQKITIFIYNEDKKTYTLSNKAGEVPDTLNPKQNSKFLRWLAEKNKIIYREFIEIDPQYDSIRKEANDYFNYTEAIVAIPLVLDGKLLGMINLGKKANLRRYRASDFYFLNTLKNESVIAISNSLLYENMEEQVRQRSQELVEVQKQLVQAEKLATVGTLAGGVAHEINNPLAAILTSVQMLLMSDTISDESDKESLQLIEEATQRCREIVKKLMFYARKPLESKEVTEVDLRDVIKNVVSFVGYQLEQENISVDIKADDKVKYMVTGNHNELEHVLTNIILNAKDAIKKIKKKGTVHLLLAKDGQQVELSVKDEGEGMSAEVRTKIFDPFFTTKDVGKGLGLGLSICHAIMERHNGEIEVESKPGKGSVFTIQLPLASKKQSKGRKILTDY